MLNIVDGQLYVSKLSLIKCPMQKRLGQIEQYNFTRNTVTENLDGIGKSAMIHNSVDMT